MRVEIPNTIAVTLHGLVSRGVKAAEVTDEGHLVLTLTDGSRADLGSVLGPQGARGVELSDDIVTANDFVEAVVKWKERR